MRNIMVKTVFSVPESHKKAFEKDSEIHRLLLSFARVQKIKTNTPVKFVNVKSPDILIINNPTTAQSVGINNLNFTPKKNLTTRLRQRSLQEFCAPGINNFPKTPPVPSIPNSRPSKNLRNLRTRTPSPSKISNSRVTKSLKNKTSATARARRARSPSITRSILQASSLPRATQNIPKVQVPREHKISNITINQVPSQPKILSKVAIQASSEAEIFNDKEDQAPPATVPSNIKDQTPIPFKTLIRSGIPCSSQVLEHTNILTSSESIVGNSESIAFEIDDNGYYTYATNISSWGNTKKKQVENLSTIDYHSAKSVLSEYVFPLPEDKLLFNRITLLPKYVSGNKYAEIFVREDLRNPEPETKTSRKRKSSFTPVLHTETSRNLRRRSETPSSPTPSLTNKRAKSTPLVNTATPNKRRKINFELLPILTPVRETEETTTSAFPSNSTSVPKNKITKRGRPKSKINSNQSKSKITGNTEEELLVNASLHTGVKFKEIRIMIDRI